VNGPRLVSVAGKAFGSFTKPFHLPLPDTGLILLNGKNRDTGGSSASGKSTLIQAMNFPFGTASIPLTALQSWYTDEYPKATNTYRIGDRLVEVSRGRSFQIRDESKPKPEEGSNKQKEEVLDKLFGMDAEMRKTLTYRGQGQRGLFLSKTDAEKKEFLTKLLGLDRFERALDASSERIKKLELEKLQLDAQLADLQQRFEQVWVSDIAELERDIAQGEALIAKHEDVASRLEKEISVMRSDAEIVAAAVPEMFKDHAEKIQARLTALQEYVVPEGEDSEELLQAREMVEEAQARVDRLAEEDRQRRQTHDNTGRALAADAKMLAKKLGSREGVIADRQRIVIELEAPRQERCPTCSRAWDQAKEKAKKLGEELGFVDGALAELDYIQEAADALEVEIAEWQTNKPSENEMLAQMRTLLADFKVKVVEEEEKKKSQRSAALAAHWKELAEAKEEMAALKNVIAYKASDMRRQALAGIGGLEELVRREREKVAGIRPATRDLQVEYGRAVEAQRQKADLQKSIDVARAKLEPVERGLAEERDFAHLVGREGFLGSIFDEVLAEISEETNDVLASIANTRNCTLEFKSEVMTQKGTARREIVPVVTINGHVTTLNFGPSGGMRSAIDLAVDLAVGAVISRRTGVCPGWLILDESFDGLGPVEKETCLEILQKYAHDRLVIVVDHMTETQGLFTQRITVESSGGESQILVE